MIPRHVRSQSAASLAREAAAIAREVSRLFALSVLRHVLRQIRLAAAVSVTNQARTHRVFLRRGRLVFLPNVNSQRGLLAAAELARRTIVLPLLRRFLRLYLLDLPPARRHSRRSKVPGGVQSFPTKPRVQVVRHSVPVQHALHGEFHATFVAGVEVDGHFALHHHSVDDVRVTLLFLVLRFHVRHGGSTILEGSTSLGTFSRGTRRFLVVQRSGHQRIVQFTIRIDVLPQLHRHGVSADDESAGRIRGEDLLATRSLPKTQLRKKKE